MEQPRFLKQRADCARYLLRVVHLVRQVGEPRGKQRQVELGRRDHIERKVALTCAKDGEEQDLDEGPKYLKSDEEQPKRRVHEGAGEGDQHLFPKIPFMNTVDCSPFIRITYPSGAAGKGGGGGEKTPDVLIRRLDTDRGAAGKGGVGGLVGEKKPRVCER